MVFDRLVGWDRVTQLLPPDVMTMLDGRYVNHTSNQTMTGSLSLTGSAPQLQITPSAAGSGWITLQSSAAGQFCQIVFASGSSGRWALMKGNETETGVGNAGSDFYILRSNDAGVATDAPFFISRSTGNITHAFSTSVNVNLTIGGALDHNGSTIGFYGVNPVARPAAYTQTYSSTTRTHATRQAASLTDSSGGTATATIAAVPVSYSQTNTRDAYASMASQINKLITDVSSTASVLNQVIDDLQANGILQ